MENIQKYIDDVNVMSIFRLGSRVYGTHTPESDHDFIIIADKWFDARDINIHVYTRTQFLASLINHEIQSLECLFLDPKHILKDDWKLDRTCMENKINSTYSAEKLRTSISTIASNSWVKGKKKLIIAGDYDLHLAIKSVFHSLRIIDFGIQIATDRRISNYGSMNYVLEDLKKMSETMQRDELWQAIDTKYRSLYNQSSSKFKELCPKALNENDYKRQLTQVLKNEGVVVTDGLLNKIIKIFN